MKICLIYPSLTVYEGDVTTPQVRPPLGLLYIAAICERYGHAVTLIDCLAEGMGSNQMLADGSIRYGLDPDTIRRRVKDDAPDAVGISAMFSAFSKDAHEAAQAVKAWRPSVPVIFGGMHAATLPHDVMTDTHVDYVVLGEGEITIIELLKAIFSRADIRDVKGVAFRNPQGRTEVTGPRERIKDLNGLPRPARHLVDMRFYSDVAENEPDNYIMRHPYTTIYTSRGCPGKCVYCAAHNVWCNRWIARSAEDVLDEIEYLVKTYGIREFHFLDDNASVNRKRFAAICQGIIDRKLNITWACPTGLAIWTLDKALLAIMKRAGCYKLCFGIESGHPETLKFIRKKLNLARVKQVIKNASDLGFWIQSTYIIGFPYETKEQIEETIDFALSTFSDFINFLLLIPYPGTEVYEILKNENLLPQKGYNYRNFGLMMSGFRTLCHNKYLTSQELNAYFDEAFKRLLRVRIKRILRHPSILLKKIYSTESFCFLLRIVFNAFGVFKIVFFKGVTRAGTLKPVYTNEFSCKK
jgi:magnesium-protoporphyrin IX monomethyl ester (oxidative) cyclase